MGIENYNAECRKIVMRYASEWEVSGETACQNIDNIRHFYM